MKYCRILILALVISFGFPIIPIVRTSTKIAVITIGTEDVEKITVKNQKQVQAITNILEKYDYQVHVWNESQQFHLLQADRLIFVYIGHSDNRTEPTLQIDGCEFNLDWFLNTYFLVSEEILLTATCFGGHWMELGRSGRLIITAINDTLTITVPIKFNMSLGVYGSIANFLLLAYNRDIPLEKAFGMWWNEILAPWYQFVNISSHYETTEWNPVIIDGIEGDVWL